MLTRTSKALAVELLKRPIATCDLIPAGEAGRIRINGDEYALSYNSVLPEIGHVEILGYRLVKSDGEVYDLPEDLSDCSCPWSTYKPDSEVVCKHRLALDQLKQKEKLA